MYASIKAQLCDIEDSFNAGYLVLVLRQKDLNCWTKTFKIAVIIIYARVWFATLVLLPGSLNKVRLTNTKQK